MKITEIITESTIEEVTEDRQLNEMDGNGSGRDGSNRRSHSTYGSRDKHEVSGGPDVHHGPESMMASKDVQDRALDALKKVLSQPENMKVLKRLKTKEGVAEGSTGVSVRGWANQVRKDHGVDVKFFNRKEGGGAVDRVVARNSQGETVGVYNRKTGYPTVYKAEIDASMNETIRKIDAQHWRLYSGKGKNLGTFDSLDAAKKHEGEVQYFKHVKEGDVVSLKTGKKVVPQAVSIRQAFGSEMANSVEDMGVRFAEKPSYWEDLEDGGAYDDRAVDELGLQRLQKQLGHKLDVFHTSDLYGGDPKSPQSNVKNMPEESVFIVQFRNGKRYLCNTDGARTYIRNWTAIKQA